MYPGIFTDVFVDQVPALLARKQGDPYLRTLVQRTKRRVYVARTESNQYSRNP